MIRKALLYLIIPVLSSLSVSGLAFADLSSSVCNSSNPSTSSSSFCQETGKGSTDTTSNNSVTRTISTAANILAALAGIAAVVMIIISGLMFVTAGGATPGQRSGDPNRVKTARATLTAAIIGLVVIALAWTITRFILDRVIQ